MTYRGKIQNGVVVLEPGVSLPDGTEVQVEPAVEKLPEPTQEDLNSLQTILLKFAGTVKDMPADFAENHDHYIHGTPRK